MVEEEVNSHEQTSFVLAIDESNEDVARDLTGIKVIASGRLPITKERKGYRRTKTLQVTQPTHKKYSNLKTNLSLKSSRYSETTTSLK